MTTFVLLLLKAKVGVLTVTNQSKLVHPHLLPYLIPTISTWP